MVGEEGAKELGKEPRNEANRAIQKSWRVVGRLRLKIRIHVTADDAKFDPMVRVPLAMGVELYPLEISGGSRARDLKLSLWRADGQPEI